jgi:hypothetical protein
MAVLTGKTILLAQERCIAIGWFRQRREDNSSKESYRW